MSDAIKKILKSKEYDFLRENEHLGKNIILLTLGGSYAYGTNTKTSDLDIRGVARNTEEELLGLSKFETFEHQETDTIIHSVNKVINLLINCNPNIVELFGTKDEHIFVITKEGEMLKNNIDLFLTKKVANSFGGYATSQLRRIENALTKGSYPQSKKEKHILHSIEKQMQHLKKSYEEIEAENVQIYLDKSNKEKYDEEIFIDLNLQHYPLRDLKNIYSEMSNITKQYGKLNHRNRKKSKESLYKHAMHLIRLLTMGAEILEGKGVHTYREKDRKFLLDIRNGKYTFDEIFEIVNVYEKKFKYAVKNTNLPENIDFKKVEELTIEINKIALGFV